MCFFLFLSLPFSHIKSRLESCEAFSLQVHKLLANLREPLKISKLSAIFYRRITIFIRSILKFMVHRVFNHLCIMFQKVSKFKVFINVRHTGQNKRGKIFVICNFWTNIKKIAQNSKKGQNIKNTY